MQNQEILWKESDIQKKEWFIILESSHQGPFSLRCLEKELKNHSVRPDSQVWRIGMREPVLLEFLFDDRPDVEKKFNAMTFVETSNDLSEEPPPLPLDILKFSPQENIIHVNDVALPSQKSRKNLIWSLLVILVMLTFFFNYYESSEELKIPRLAKMSPDLHQKIKEDILFQGFQAPIVLKEYVAKDYSHIWLATNSFYQCQEVFGEFDSQKNRVFQSLNSNAHFNQQKKIQFQSTGRLENHLIDFSTFEFTQGAKLLPGIYQLNLTFKKCQHSRWISRMENEIKLLLHKWKIWTNTEDVFHQKKMSFQVVLYSQGAQAFEIAFEKYQKRKKRLLEKQRKYGKVFWENIAEKFKTLNALASNIEEHLLNFLDQKNFKNEKVMGQKFRAMVQNYTISFGPFLTSFVVENDKSLSQSSAEGISYKMKFDHEVKNISEKIGQESMILIEEMQKLLQLWEVAPKARSSSEKVLNALALKVQTKFSQIQKKINQQISQTLSLQNSELSHPDK